MRLLVFVWAFFWLFSTTQAVVIEKIVAVVNGKPITLTELQERAIFIKNATGQELPLREVLKKVIMEELQMQEAEKLGLVASDDVVNSYIENFKKENHLSDEEFKKFLEERGITLEAYREEIRRRITINRLMNYEIRMHVAVPDEEVKEYYKTHKEEFRRPPAAEVWLIFIPKEEGKALAEEIFAKAAGGFSFEALAKKYSKGPNAEKGGYLGFVEKGELLEDLDKVVFDSDKKLALVERPEGYYIVKVGKRRKENYAPFEEVKEQIRKKLLEERTEKRYQKWLNTLLDKATIKILM